MDSSRSTTATFLATVCTAGAGLLATLVQELAAIAAFSVVAAAYGAWATSKTEVNLDRRNFERYRLAHRHLDDLRLDLDEFRRRLAGGELPASEEFYAPVFSALVADHEEWLKAAQQKEAALGGIEKRLRDVERERTKSPGAPGGPAPAGPGSGA